MSISHRSSWRAVAVIAATLSFGFAAGPASAGGTTDPVPDPAADGTTVSLVDDPRVALSFTHPIGWELTDVEIDAADDAAYVDPCAETLRFSLGADDDEAGWRGVTVEMVPVECDADNTMIGNGFHGLYRTIDDVPEPVDETTVDTPAGVAVTFEQTYFECTNECNDYVDRVAILTLEEPADDRYPSVVIRDEAGELDHDEIALLLDGLGIPTS